MLVAQPTPTYTIFYHGNWQLLKGAARVGSNHQSFSVGTAVCKPRSCLLHFPQRHDARPSRRARLSTHRRNPSKVQASPSAGRCTWDPVSAFLLLRFRRLVEGHRRRVLPNRLQADHAL